MGEARPFGRYFEDFKVCDVYRHWPGKTITEYDDRLFCMITMNHHRERRMDCRVRWERSDRRGSYPDPFPQRIGRRSGRSRRPVRHREGGGG